MPDEKIKTDKIKEEVCKLGIKEENCSVMEALKKFAKGYKIQCEEWDKIIDEAREIEKFNGNIFNYHTKKFTRKISEMTSSTDEALSPKEKLEKSGEK